MPIENIQIANENKQMVTQSAGLVSTPVIMAGLLVRHKLLPHRYLLEGFVVEDSYFNHEDFKYNNLEIKYKETKFNDYKSYNGLIYSKLVIDGQKNPFSVYFKSENKFRVRNTLVYSYHDYTEKEGDYFIGKDLFNRPTSTSKTTFEYYLYLNPTSELPECAANKVFALCKHFEEGQFKYALFHLHELIPET